MIVYGLDISNKEEVIKWLNKIRKGSGDARPLWLAMQKKIPQFTDYEFDPKRDSHKLWITLTPEYEAWKKRKGFPVGMGYLFGSMREAAGKRAIKKISKNKMLWIVNPKVATEKGAVGDYMYRFHWGYRGTDKLGRKIDQPAREMLRYTHLRVSSFLKLDAKKFKSGVTHASFTYNWLRKVLEVG